MDTGTLRPYNPMMPRSVRLDHVSIQGKVNAVLNVADQTKVILGSDFSKTTHSSDTMANGILNDDASFNSVGLFTEANHKLSEKQSWILGYRVDFHDLNDKRLSSSTAGQSRKENTQSGFIRHEYKFTPHATGYFGLGHHERLPDYWELIAMSANSMGTLSAFQRTKKEVTNQIDAGFLYKKENYGLNVSTFANKINDYILINYHGLGMMVRGVSTNIDAHTYGFEANGFYMLAPHLKLNSSLSYTKGHDETNHVALAQLPPLEAQLGLQYDDKKWALGGVVRFVSAKKDFSQGYGNIAGKDIGVTGGFAVFSLNAAYKPAQHITFNAGVDNLFNKNYAEFISRSGNSMGMSIPGYTQTIRVNEPGRMIWLKGTFSFK
jgi:iron complex outermembrane recepter protein